MNEAPTTYTHRPPSPSKRAALARLVDEDDPDPDSAEASHAREEKIVEESLNLNEQRLMAATRHFFAPGVTGCSTRIFPDRT